MQEFQERAATAEAHLEEELQKSHEAINNTIEAERRVSELQLRADNCTRAVQSLSLECISAKSRANAAEKMSKEADRRLQVHVQLHSLFQVQNSNRVLEFLIIASRSMHGALSWHVAESFSKNMIKLQQ